MVADCLVLLAVDVNAGGGFLQWAENLLGVGGSRAEEGLEGPPRISHERQLWLV
jgi:hypothetical protein